jgi:hypothetical protein
MEREAAMVDKEVVLRDANSMKSRIVTTKELVVPFRDTRVPASMRLPRGLLAALAGAVLTGVLMSRRGRTGRRESRVVRGLLGASTAAYFVAATLDLAEHLRLEKRVTSHYLRWVAVPLSESVVHTMLLATNLSVLLLARPIRRRRLARRDRVSPGERSAARTSSIRPSTSRRA